MRRHERTNERIERFAIGAEANLIKMAQRQRPSRSLLKMRLNVTSFLTIACFVTAALDVCQALQIEQVTFPEHVMLGQTITMVCEYNVGQSEYIDSIKWYKDNLEFYRIVPNTPIEHDRVVTFPRPGIKLEKEKSGVSPSSMLGK